MTGKSLKAQKNGRLVGSLALPANEEKMSARDWGKLLHVSLQLLLSRDFDERIFKIQLGPPTIQLDTLNQALKRSKGIG